MPKYYQGKFKPNNPDKYKGDLTNIVYRSSWELSAMLQLDKDPNIVEWSSEETIVPYISPVDGRRHRYFIDLTYRTKDGKKFMIEIKPAIQCRLPKQPKRKTKKYITELAEFGKNQAKWKAAREYAKDRGYQFDIWTEKELGLGSKV